MPDHHPGAAIERLVPHGTQPLRELRQLQLPTRLESVGPHRRHTVQVNPLKPAAVIKGILPDLRHPVRDTDVPDRRSQERPGSDLRHGAGDLPDIQPGTVKKGPVTDRHKPLLQPHRFQGTVPEKGRVPYLCHHAVGHHPLKPRAVPKGPLPDLRYGTVKAYGSYIFRNARIDCRWIAVQDASCLIGRRVHLQPWPGKELPCHHQQPVFRKPIAATLHAMVSVIPPYGFITGERAAYHGIRLRQPIGFPIVGIGPGIILPYGGKLPAIAGLQNAVAKKLPPVELHLLPGAGSGAGIVDIHIGGFYILSAHHEITLLHRTLVKVDAVI